MQKPSSYDTTQAVNIGEYESLEPGGYICKILKAESTLSSTRKEMLVINFDIAEGQHKDFYARKYKASTSDNKKWQGVYRQLTDGDSTKYFKGMITAIEKSNSGFKFDFDEKKLTGKLFGGLFGREEWFDTNKGEYKFSVKLCWVRDIETIKSGKFEIPRDKLLKRDNNPPPGFYDDSVDVSDEDEDLPF